jgi:hypothetical protein
MLTILYFSLGYLALSFVVSVLIGRVLASLDEVYVQKQGLTF